ncbi:MAG: hypothetical protein NVSMB65_15350 [Chloroflexota bacterium]
MTGAAQQSCDLTEFVGPPDETADQEGEIMTNGQRRGGVLVISHHPAALLVEAGRLVGRRAMPWLGCRHESRAAGRQ